jgi:radical SAM superfamily enzyme YgiQ (UPF0313 family)
MPDNSVYGITNMSTYNNQYANLLPTSRKEMLARGWEELDVILFSGDAYVDHPSFGIAVLGRVLESKGYRVGIVPQPNWRDDLRDFKKMGKPRLFFGVSAGAMDSMVNHYTANKRLRSDDAYTPGGKAGYRPDYPTIVYSQILKNLFPDTPLIIGGVEASMRRFTHYDYWQDKLKPSILVESGADLLVYGMGEKAITDIARLIEKGVPVENLHNIPQTAFITNKEISLIAERDSAGFSNNFAEIKNKGQGDEIRSTGKGEDIEYTDRGNDLKNTGQGDGSKREIDGLKGDGGKVNEKKGGVQGKQPDRGSLAYRVAPDSGTETGNEGLLQQKSEYYDNDPGKGRIHQQFGDNETGQGRIQQQFDDNESEQGRVQQQNNNENVSGAVRLQQKSEYYDNDPWKSRVQHEFDDNETGEGNVDQEIGDNGNDTGSERIQRHYDNETGQGGVRQQNSDNETEQDRLDQQNESNEKDSESVRLQQKSEYYDNDSGEGRIQQRSDNNPGQGGVQQDFNISDNDPGTIRIGTSASSKKDAVRLFSHEECLGDKKKYAANFRLVEEESNKLEPSIIMQSTGTDTLVVNPPYPVAEESELDRIYDLPFTRLPHPRYHKKGTIPAYEMIRHSVTMHRGCFGGCSFCTISAHQGKFVSSRSEKSVIKEVEKVTKMPDFKGYISDLGGPSANMYKMQGKDIRVCAKCKKPSCIFPVVCPNLETSPAPLLSIYRKVRAMPGIKKAFVGSGVRYDLFLDKIDQKSYRDYARELIKHHVSGRLKVAPEHSDEKVLKLMRKPSFSLYRRMHKLFDQINREEKLNQQLIPYFISSHPGCGNTEMAELAVTTKEMNIRPEQVQDFTPTPMTLATVIYYTSINPYTMEKVKVARGKEEKLSQQQFFFWYKQEYRSRIKAELYKMGRKDLAEKLLGTRE